MLPFHELRSLYHTNAHKLQLQQEMEDAERSGRRPVFHGLPPQDLLTLQVQLYIEAQILAHSEGQEADEMAQMRLPYIQGQLLTLYQSYWNLAKICTEMFALSPIWVDSILELLAQHPDARFHRDARGFQREYALWRFWQFAQYLGLTTAESPERDLCLRALKLYPDSLAVLDLIEGYDPSLIETNLRKPLSYFLSIVEQWIEAQIWEASETDKYMWDAVSGEEERQGASDRQVMPLMSWTLGLESSYSSRRWDLLNSRFYDEVGLSVLDLAWNLSSYIDRPTPDLRDGHLEDLLDWIDTWTASTNTNLEDVLGTLDAEPEVTWDMYKRALLGTRGWTSCEQMYYFQCLLCEVFQGNVLPQLPDK